MIKRLSTMGLLLVSAALAAETSVAEPAVPVVLAEFLSDARSLEASFEQEIYSADQAQLLESSSGTVVIERPDRFRWSYDTPEQLIVADGQRISFFDIELDQLTISPQQDSLAGSPAALLGGGQAALAAFEVLGQFESADVSWVRLRPLAEDSDFERVSLGFARNGDLSGMELTDALGQTTRVRFANYRVNEPIDETLFTLVVPDYVDVIDKTILTQTLE